MIARIFTAGLLLIPTVALAAQEEQAVREAVAAIEAAGGRVMKIAANTEDQEVQFYLSDKEVNDKALQHLALVPNLVWLNLRGTKITDAGLIQLQGLTGLTRLHLEKTGIGDAGLAHLSKLAQLEYLNLYGTLVTDAGLEQLRELKKLKKLYLWQTQVTEQGVGRLKEALPETEIVLGLDLAPVEKKQETAAPENP